MAGARFANFGSNIGSLALYALSGHIFVPAGLTMGVGAFLGARLGAHAALRAGARLVRPLIVVVSCAMALRLMTAPGGLLSSRGNTSDRRLTPSQAEELISRRSRLGRNPALLVFRRTRGALGAAPRELEFMANTKSAQKAARQTIRRTAVNKSRRSEMRTYVRKVEEALASKDPKAAAEALSEAEPRLARAAQKGIVHKNAASRKISRLTKRVKALAV